MSEDKKEEKPRLQFRIEYEVENQQDSLLIDVCLVDQYDKSHSGKKLKLSMKCNGLWRVVKIQTTGPNTEFTIPNYNQMGSIKFKIVCYDPYVKKKITYRSPKKEIPEKILNGSYFGMLGYILKRRIKKEL